MHGKKCDVFEHGWCRPCWTTRSLEENWQIPKYFLLNWAASAKFRRVSTTNDTYIDTVRLVSSRKCVLAYAFAVNQEQRGISCSYLQVAGSCGAEQIQLRASALGAVKTL